MGSSFEPATEDEMGDKLYISGRIVKKSKFSVTKRNKQILPIVIRSKMDDGRTSVIHAVLTDKNARMVHSFDSTADVSITAEGHLNFRHTAVEVYIDSADIYRKGDTNNA